MDNIEFIANVSEVKIMKMHKNIRVTLEIPAGTCSSLLAGMLQSHGYDETHFKVILSPMNGKEIKEKQEEVRKEEEKEEGKKERMKRVSSQNSQEWAVLVLRYSQLTGRDVNEIHEAARKKHNFSHFRDQPSVNQQVLINGLSEMIDKIEIPGDPNNT